VALEIKLEFFAEAVNQALDNLLEAVDSEAILDEAGTLLLNRIRTRFLAETSPDGSKWIPSKAAIKRRAKGGTGTLFDTGNLFRSLQLAALGPNERMLFTDVEYAPPLHFGMDPFTFKTSKGNVAEHPGLPARPFMDINDDDIELAVNLIILRVERAFSV
jgi:phage gpG-like protein